MSNFYNIKEDEDLKMLNDWNEQIKAFETITANPLGSQTDIVATDKKGNYYSIELKQREGSFSGFTFNDVFIEPSKISALVAKKNKNKHKILYINFFSNGNEVVIWNFDKDINNIKYYNSVPIFDKGCNCKKREPRFGLPLDQVTYYGKIDGEYKKIKK